MSAPGNIHPFPTNWDRLQRTLRLLSLEDTHRGGLSFAEVARLLNIREDHVGKYIDEIASRATWDDPDPGEYIDIYVDEDTAKVRISGRRSLPGPTRFTMHELLALFTLIDQVRAPDTHLGIQETAERLRGKLLSAVPEDVQSETEPLSRRVRVQPAGAGCAEHVSLIHEAHTRRLKVEVEYFSRHSGKLWKHPVEPHLLIQQHGIWYMVTERGYVLRVERMKSVCLTDETFEIPPDFDPDEYRLKFMFRGDSNHELVIRTRWGTRAVKTASPREIRKWVLKSRGGQVIEQPPEQKDELLAEARELLERYAADVD